MLHDRANAYSLGMVRIWVFSLAALSRVLTPVWEVCMLPNYQANGVMRLLGAYYWAPLITPQIAYGIQAFTIGLLIAAAAGIRPYRILAPLACLTLIISEGLIRGSEVMSHANIILILCTCALACFPAADALTLFPITRQPTRPLAQYRAALFTLSMVFCVTYLFAGARRLSTSGIEIYFDDSILRATALRDAELGPAGGLGIWACESVFVGWALRIGFPIVTLLEFLAPLCIFSARFRWLWIAVLFPFHIGIGLLMGIWFPYNLALIPVLIAGFDPFRRLTDRIDAAKPDDGEPELVTLN
ncbi:MAG TPA: hypothetical protein PLN21_17405 [Gemmatales bacterium]|nr:hypothetical protein [Gemmatales bacterium]